MGYVDFALGASKRAGFFRLSKFFFKYKLLILCYHGLSFNDEHLFKPKLFMTRELFEHRMKWLKDNGYCVISLEEARQRLRQNALEPYSVVITFDDGFYSTAALAYPVLSSYGFPFTVYMTTYYCQKSNPVFRLVVQYMFWATRHKRLKVHDLVPGTGDGSCDSPLDYKLMWQIIDHAEQVMSESGRVELCRVLGTRLEVDYEELKINRRLSLLTEYEIAKLSREGVDFQLHTHRHCLPESHDLICREIQECRTCLSPLLDKQPTHLCYPSGIWSENHWKVLVSLGIVSATTCECGFVDRNTPPLAWPRFLDAQDIPQVVFESEVTGFKSIFRELRKRVV